MMLEYLPTFRILLGVIQMEVNIHGASGIEIYDDDGTLFALMIHV